MRKVMILNDLIMACLHHIYVMSLSCRFKMSCFIYSEKKLGPAELSYLQTQLRFFKAQTHLGFFTAFTSSPRFGPLHCILLNWLLINSLFWIQASQGKDTKHTVQKNNTTGKSKHTDDFLLFWGPLNIESEPYTWRMSNDFVQVYNMVIWLGPTWYVLSSLAHSHDYDYNQNQSHILIIPWPL